MSGLLWVFAAAAVPLVSCGGCASEGAPASASPQEHGVPSLAARYGALLRIGAAVDTATIGSQRDLLLAQVSSLVAENDMKWERIHPRPVSGAAAYDFRAADRIVRFAEEHRMAVRGHALVWHQQTPAWVFEGSEEEVLARLEGHVSTVVARYRGRVGCWDVLNEVLADDGSLRAHSPWQRAAGGDDGGLPRYIVKACQAARAADPAARLFYNDYGIESGAKLEGACRLARALKERGLIDGVGIQGHWSAYTVDPGAVREAIRRFAALGLEVEITELDLSVYRWGDTSALPAFTPALDALLARSYGGLFAVFREEAAAGRLTRVTFWGIADDHTWLDNFPVKGRKDWPLLFDEKHQPKGAFWAVAEW